MAEFLKSVLAGYTIVFDKWADPRTKNLFLVAKPYEGLTLIAFYLLFVLKWGPKFMKNRKPYNLDKFMIVYNAIQVVINAYLFINGCKFWCGRYKLFCEPIDYSESKEAMEMVYLVYIYYLSKVLDLVDTIFFVLRKKFNQVTFLHLYHHAGMVMLIWGAVTYLPGGHATFVGWINSFVHIVMYSYYLLTVAVPTLKNNLWWKKYVTLLQIIQFFLCIIQFGAIPFVPNCAYPQWTTLIFLPQNIFILILFSDFYIKTYIMKPKENEPVTSQLVHEDTKLEERYKSEKVRSLIEEIDESKLHLRKVNRS